MEPMVLLVVALALAMDAFAVAVGASIAERGFTPRQVFRMSFHFGLFQALMTVLGWAAGAVVWEWLRDLGHWAAFALLAAVGTRSIMGALNGGGSGKGRYGDPTRGPVLVFLSLATSLDALAVGLGLGVMGVSIAVPAAVIGLVALVVTAAGALVGSGIGRHLGSVAEVMGGVMLWLVGLYILWDHMAS